MKINFYKFLIGLIIVVILILGYFLYKSLVNNQSLNTQNNLNNQDIGNLVDMSFVTEVSVTSDFPYGNVGGSYPQFRNADPSFNDKIKNNIIIYKSEFENNAKDNYEAMLDTNKLVITNEEKERIKSLFSFDVKTEYVQVNPNFISILMKINAYSGGAHGYEILYSYNYDVKNGKEISLGDLFPGTNNYLNKVSEYSRTDLYKQLSNKIQITDYDEEEDYEEAIKNMNEMLSVGTEPTEDNFSIFTIEPNILNIYFSQYQVAPYAYGSQLVEMPLE